jgi:membrane protein DedA with SNARE-associated domain
MEPLTLFVEHWGYAAIFAVVVLGNLGLPVPEETILTLAGYLVWRGDLRLGLVLIVAIASASAGDNGSYWLGRSLGSRALHRYQPLLGLNPARLEAGKRFVAKHGALAVFLGRFLPGLRFAVGPLAGIAGIPAPRFFIANVLGACCYVPAVVGVGYAIGRGAGPRLAYVRTTVVAIELAVASAAILGTLWALGIRAKRSRSSPQPDPSTIVSSVPEIATP